MAGVPDRPGGSGPGGNEPEYEVIGGGMIDDQRRMADTPRAGSDSRTHPGAVFRTAAGAAWQSARNSFTSWWFWLACAAGVALAWGLAAVVVAWADSNGWFERSVPGAVLLIMAAILALAAAVLGTGWGFRHAGGSVLELLLAGAMRGVALAALACSALFAVGFSVGGPIALAGAAVVVIVLEAAVFGLIGAGSRVWFASAAAGVALATVLVTFLCFGNVAVTLLLLPGTTEMDQASVPVNVQRDDSGRVTSYLCVGDLRPVEVAHTERVAWLAASNPALLLGSVGAEFVSTDNDVGWLLAGLQWAADGPSREVPCLGGESSDGQAPAMPVALTGLALQGLVAAVVVIPGRWLASRRLAAGSRSG
ncbi:hypothetical protein FQP90_11080 [Paenarthrobacter nitroguajacolicus]|uniref:Uncharacterized protein n=1 Tax=Paenarthrobacter nitroguajacolicus TaxID=211146 RepID=A0A558H0V0_PAENT|nr:hypothetical protein [Paenarthrobacter nitroguajacolicus]TVU62767.1 hypothetical protein FQP90_11080 [Paenarthrobacter nitroguajacolicus]